MKRIAEVAITTPSEVIAFLGKASQYRKGMILVIVPEIGYFKPNYIVCRYALSIPYYKAKKGDRVWIEPTMGETDRWIYTGFVDCGDEDIDPTVPDTVGLFPFEDGKVTFSIGELGEISIDSISKEILIKMDESIIKVESNKVSINGTNLVVEV